MVINYPIDKLIIYKGLDCYDSCVATYIHNSSLPHELLYSEFWNETDFEYDAEKYSFRSKKILKNLYFYFETTIIYYENFTEQNIYELIDTYHIFMAQTDLFYYPFSPSFQIHHSPHFFLIHGYDLDEKKIYISDPSQKFQDKKMNINNFMNIQKKVFIFYSKTLEKEKIFTIKKKKEINISCDKLVKSLEYIENGLKEIFDEERNISDDRLIKEALFFNRLSNNRFCYLKYLEAYYQKKQMVFNCLNDFERIGKKYETIKNMLYKCVVMKNRKHICENIVAYYRETIAEEQEIASILNAELVRFHMD